MSPLRTAEHPWVVLVEDDEPLEHELADALERALPDIEVQHTPDADFALELVRDGRSCLLITETHSHAVDGLTLAACARLRRPGLPLIFLSDHPADARAHVAAFGGSHLVDKPPHIEHLVELVTQLLCAPSGFHGELRSHDLIELVQLVAMTMPSGALHLWTPEGRGTMWFDRGEVVHACGQGEEGMRAFQRMLSWTGGGFSLEAGGTPPSRTIMLTTTQLLLESARILDEEVAHRRPEQSGTLPIIRSAAEHFERGLVAVQHKRYADALSEWDRAASFEPGNRVYQHNLRRLRALIASSESKISGGGE